RAVMDEVYGETNLVSAIAFKKTSGTGSNFLENIYDFALWYAKDLSRMKYRQPLTEKGSSRKDGVHPWTGSIPAYAVASCESFRWEPVGALFLAVPGDECLNRRRHAQPAANS
ncbi:MAG: hypothetical protein M3495_07385, partial [Pseudomonadota bacterium]|nr:hypothetical protein [Pseudomonadota bacterium]